MNDLLAELERLRDQARQDMIECEESGDIGDYEYFNGFCDAFDIAAGLLKEEIGNGTNQ